MQQSGLFLSFGLEIERLRPFSPVSDSFRRPICDTQCILACFYKVICRIMYGQLRDRHLRVAADIFPPSSTFQKKSIADVCQAKLKLSPASMQPITGARASRLQIARHLPDCPTFFPSHRYFLRTISSPTPRELLRRVDSLIARRM